MAFTYSEPSPSKDGDVSFHVTDHAQNTYYFKVTSEALAQVSRHEQEPSKLDAIDIYLNNLDVMHKVAQNLISVGRSDSPIVITSKMV